MANKPKSPQEEQREMLIAYEMGANYRKKMSVLRALAELKVDKFLKKYLHGKN